MLTARKCYSNLYETEGVTLPRKHQQQFGKQFGHDYPFNQKSDNFLELQQIHNVAIASLTDEEELGNP